MKLGRSSNIFWTIIPTIAVVAAMFVGFSYINIFVREYLAKEKVTVRSLEGVEVLKGPLPVLEQKSPPSPEEVVEAFYRQLEEDKLGRPRPAPLEPVLEEEPAVEIPVELHPVEIPPIEVPGLIEEDTSGGSS